MSHCHMIQIYDKLLELDKHRCIWHGKHGGLYFFRENSVIIVYPCNLQLLLLLLLLLFLHLLLFEMSDFLFLLLLSLGAGS